MRNLFLLIFTLGYYPVFSQEPTSFYFTAPQPAGEKSLEKIPSGFSGVYLHPTDSLKKLFVTEDSIYARIILAAYLTMEEINNDPLLHVKDTLLYGVYPDKGIPYFRTNDTIIYFMADDYIFFKPGEKQVARISGTSLLLNYKDNNNNWSALMLTRSSDGDLIVAEIDHEKEMPLIEKQKGIRKKKVGGITTYFLNMSLEEMNDFISAGGFNISSKYKPEE